MLATENDADRSSSDAVSPGRIVIDDEGELRAHALRNMRDVKRVLDAGLLPRLVVADWGGTIAHLYKACDGLEIWTTLFGYPGGHGQPPRFRSMSGSRRRSPGTIVP
jgi:hypothetical protein